MQHDPKIVEALGLAYCQAALGSHRCSCIGQAFNCANEHPGNQANVALDILCTLLHTTPEAMSAMMRGEAVVVPVEPVREMWAAGGNVLVNRRKRHHDAVLADIWRDMLAASPYAKDPSDA